MNDALAAEIDHALARIHQGVAEYPFVHHLIDYNLRVLQSVKDHRWELFNGHYQSCDKCQLRRDPLTTEEQWNTRHHPSLTNSKAATPSGSASSTSNIGTQ